MEVMPSRIPSLRILILLLSLAGLNGCGEMRPMGAGDELITYTVKPGDTLYSISWRYGYDHRQVAAWNDIPPPYLIYVGQHIRLISPYQRTARAIPNHAPSPATPRALPSSNQVAVSKPAELGPSSTVIPATHQNRKTSNKIIEKTLNRHHNGKVAWRWPTEGHIRNRFDPSSGKKGLDIEGRMGQPVVAAAGGTVVYSGDGLIGYGNLVIIKHDETYLSAYGHNRRLLVKEGSEVKQGQKIAEMGDSGKQGVILHFEIRRDGKPVDPLRYLPKRGS